MRYPREGVCMFMDKRKVKLTKGMFISNKIKRIRMPRGKDGYLEIYLGDDAQGKPCFMTAHRIICWAFYGSSLDPSKALVEHSCDKSSCLNPLHLGVGHKKSNHRSNREKKRGGNMKARALEKHKIG